MINDNPKKASAAVWDRLGATNHRTNTLIKTTYGSQALPPLARNKKKTLDLIFL
jgi:hypothetical protein